MKFSDRESSKSKILLCPSASYTNPDEILSDTPRGTTFAGIGKVCSDSLTPNLKRAAKLRTQNYW